jgi:hypothetical protein
LSAACAVLFASQAAGLIAVGHEGMLRYYTEILPAVSAYYTRFGLNGSMYGALLRLFGGAADVEPLWHTPRLILPLTLAASALGIVGLTRLKPESAPFAVLVVLPTAWYYSVVLALPAILEMLRSGRRYWAICALVGFSFVLPLVFVVGEFAGHYSPPMALLLAIQPVTACVLLTVACATEPR